MDHNAVALEETAKTFRADMWDTVCEDVALECGILQRHFGPVQVSLFESLPNSPLVNTILGVAERGAVSGGHLARAVEWADSLGVDYRVRVCRAMPEEALAERWLNQHGFEQGRGVVKYVRDGSMPSFPRPSNMTVWELEGDGSAVETMMFAASPAAGLPSDASILLSELPAQEHWHSYSVELRNEIVAFGSMLIRDDVAILGLDGTVEAARGNGCHQALLHERLVAASRAGCRTVFSEVGECDHEGVAIAARNLLRAGFVPAYRSMHWQRPRARQVISDQVGPYLY